MQEDCNCVICSEKTDNIDLNPLSGKTEYVCENCLDQSWEQVQCTPEVD